MKKSILPLLILALGLLNGCSPYSNDYIIVESVTLQDENDGYNHKYFITFRDDGACLAQAGFYTNKLYQVGDTLK